MASKKISIVLADVDGTLVDSKKRLTERAKRAIQKLEEAGIKFAVTSGRPPRGMKMIAEETNLSTPIAAFNGGMIVEAKTLKVLSQQTLDAETAQAVIKRIGAFNLDVWVYAGVDWYLRDLKAPHREKEEQTVQFPPKVVENFDEALQQGVAKVVGVSDDYNLVATAEKGIIQEFEHGVHAKCTTTSRDCEPSVSAARSQPYYLDVTHPKANKGFVVEMLSDILKIPPTEFLTIGDMPNDVLMFEKSGSSVAMGQASEEVKKSATYVTAGMDDEGFAKGMEQFVLG
ncbi:MAG: HAD family phosphatase [Verrucomicrobia bacterium]|nr:HAD family phosphatase [Verrucomicrobiota bacterium]MBV8376587.1 HAD family phosphatase [Verrucomicrobiota bacterium]